MLSRARFGDHSGLTHALGDQDLSNCVIDLMSAGVIEVFALEIDRSSAEVVCESFRKIEGRWAADVICVVISQFRLKRGVVLGLVVRFGQDVERVHERFGDETSSEGAKAAEGVGEGCSWGGDRRRHAQNILKTLGRRSHCPSGETMRSRDGTAGI